MINSLIYIYLLQQIQLTEMNNLFTFSADQLSQQLALCKHNQFESNPFPTRPKAALLTNGRASAIKTDARLKKFRSQQIGNQGSVQPKKNRQTSMHSQSKCNQFTFYQQKHKKNPIPQTHDLDLSVRPDNSRRRSSSLRYSPKVNFPQSDRKLPSVFKMKGDLSSKKSIQSTKSKNIGSIQTIPQQPNRYENAPSRMKLNSLVQFYLKKDEYRPVSALAHPQTSHQIKPFLLQTDLQSITTKNITFHRSKRTIRHSKKIVPPISAKLMREEQQKEKVETIETSGGSPLLTTFYKPR